MPEDLPVRKRLRLKGYNYSQNGAYFITVCVKDRHELLGTIYENNAENMVTDVGAAVLCGPPYPRPAPVTLPILRIELSEIGEQLSEYLKRMDTSCHSIRLDNYIVMPNHVHLLITINDVGRGSGTQRTASPTTDTPASAIIPRIVHGMKSHTMKIAGESIWQRSYHDHIVRNETEYRKIWNYIDANVQNWKSDVFYNKK